MNDWIYHTCFWPTKELPEHSLCHFSNDAAGLSGLQEKEENPQWKIK